ncbi:copper chaperone [Natronobacillus azotifigens]|uniref:Copper chaperone CopZ n=1 Tax=Natronobacillus azotifigens TaxID=472978 RepID=A0A9J6REI6_9BACI|nr:cation transporter [Natronobacillus azotifigens]MCZ0704162.1 cation transporter [Natronobacillus azotifigens]
METIIFYVEGMSCGHCAKSIQGSLEQLEGVWHSDVSVVDKTVKIMYEISKIDIKNLIKAITDTGYQVIAYN